MTTLNVIDGAMEGRHGTHPDFECETCEFNDWLEPPSPFAKLLRTAFGAHLDLKDVDGESQRWQSDVIDAFADRSPLALRRGIERDDAFVAKSV